jgi:hypothetical protein
MEEAPLRKYSATGPLLGTPREVAPSWKYVAPGPLAGTAVTAVPLVK